MSRPKKNKPLQVNVDEKTEIYMSEIQVLETLETEVDLARKELEKIRSDIEEAQSKMKTMAVREVSQDEMLIVKKSVSVSVEKQALKEKIEKEKAYDNVRVTGKFINRRAPGQMAKLTYLKYEDDPVKWFEMQDGKVYTIPRGFADQIKEYYHTPHFIQNSQAMDPNKPASTIHEVDTSNKKYDFVPISF